MGLFSRREPTPPAQTGGIPSQQASWSSIETVRKEWPAASLDPVRDRQGVERANVLYERDDYPAMMECATLYATALAHSLHGDGILHGEPLHEAVHRAVYCSLCAPPDGRTFAATAQKAARVAMTIMRENGWQPPSVGGSDPHFEPFFADTGNRMLLGTAIAPENEPWAGDLRKFFAVPPTATVGELPNADVDRGRDAVDRMYEAVEQAKDGDTASSLYMDGLALLHRGDAEGALGRFSQAARLGSVESMALAGDAARQLGRVSESRLWYESAANAGHPIGMFNTAIAAVQDGDINTARRWFQAAAEGGNLQGYAALAQLAGEAGDEAGELRWAGLGAEGGHLWCMSRYGLLLYRSSRGDVPTLRKAREYLEQAAARGDLDSAGLAVALNRDLGDVQRGRRFVDQVVQSGNSKAIDRLRRYGLL